MSTNSTKTTQTYAVTTFGNMVIIPATSPESALAQAKGLAEGSSMLASDVTAGQVRVATQEEIDWHEAMSGPLTPAQGQAFSAAPAAKTTSIPVTRTANSPKLPVSPAPRGPWNMSGEMPDAQKSIVDGLAATIHNIRHISSSVNGSVCVHIGNGDGDYSQDQSFVVMPSGEVRYNAPVKARPMGPNKKASPNCQSGGRDYCTCNICF